MRIAAAVVVASLSAVPLFPRSLPRISQARGGTSVQVRPVPHGMEQAARLRRELQERAVRATAVITNRSSRALVIPAAGSARGNGGTFFRSDVTLVNWNAREQHVRLVWAPNGNPVGNTEFDLTIPSGMPFTLEDFVGTYLHKSGVGSLTFFPVDVGGAPDDDAAFDAYSRIWTPQPNATGTVSQPFPGVDYDQLDGEYEAVILGLRHDAAYRTNYGIVNNTGRDVSFTVTIVPEGQPNTPYQEIPVRVGAGSMIQAALPAGTYGKLSLFVSIDEDLPQSSFSWSAFASSTDNITGDGWVSIGAQPFDDDGLDTASLAAGTHR